MFGEKLKKLRTDKHMTQQELAKILKISSSTIGMYEQNRRSPDIQTLKLIAKYFNVSVDYLLGNSDDKTIPTPKEDTPVEKISKSLGDDPELSEFWNVLKEREDLKLLFKQTKDMAPNDIKKIIRIIKAIEDEEDRNDG
ncbi:helix-turn-helix domain-containing protein [Clostridium ljungdahlii]|uniref:HTH-type transcriptional regulator Xre n=1 Tax=Clostridium ljungdahlii TaxID=1538 RepID=A0A162L530_9CLOT|nr:helix-turn-helix transcriptional regulator [Clostridium ljungdahlii]OAA91222.1 HTH-type transcriptional regulator Xre [Clostridium ljungdahlii]